MSSLQTSPHALSGPRERQNQPKRVDPWWNNAVIYEIYPRSFQDSNGDGIGDLNGITSRLDYLKSLGVDAIWLAPATLRRRSISAMTSPTTRISIPPYGTLADFDRLVADAKKRNIRIVMDMVLNHTSDKHQWFIEVRQLAHQSQARLVRLAATASRAGANERAANNWIDAWRIGVAVGPSGTSVLLSPLRRSAARP